MANYIADGTAEETGIFRGLAQAPLYFHNAIAELVDNSIAAKNTKFKIQIDISQKPNEPDSFLITVVDNCSGVSLNKLQNHVFKVGALPLPNSSHLSEHGWGLKNVLAKIETTHSKPWEILTRDSDCIKTNVFYRVKGPLKYQIPITDETAANWPKYGSTDTGTIVSFTTSLSFLKTVSMGKRGRPPQTISSIMDHLREHLGVFYRGYIEGGKKAVGDISTSINWKNSEDVEPIYPDYQTKNTIKPFEVTTHLGKIKIAGETGLLDTNSLATRKDRVYYYRNTMESQGTDFRIGDRTVMTRLLTEIWQKARHPSYNAFWGEFRIPGDKSKAPKTLNNKTSIDFDDPTWLEIVEAIRDKIPEPSKYKATQTEAELREELANQLKAHALSGDVINENHPCYSGAGVPVDIYRDESKRTGDIYIYETKAGKLQPLDVYQLVMYWDGLVEDGITPRIAYLVGLSKTTAVETVINAMNNRTDKSGNKYRLECKLWKDYDIAT